MTKFTKSQMTNQQHPITPPPELVEQWAHMFEQHTDAEVFNQAARWGADQELEACVEWLQDPDLNVDTYKLRAARRPKPPSLKEQVSKALDRVPGPGSDSAYLRQWSRAEAASLINDVRRALEALPND